LDKNGIEINGNVSTYSGFILDNNDKTGYRKFSDNYGLALAYGLSEKMNLKFRYEKMNTVADWEIFDLQLEIPTDINYFEFAGKFQLNQDETAIMTPIGIYSYGDELLFTFAPRFLATIRNNNHIELNVSAKMNIFFGDDIFVMPGFNLGLGVSSNLDKWAFRPEIGYDGFFTAGAGISYYLN
jgi:hypothetical protein